MQDGTEYEEPKTESTEQYTVDYFIQKFEAIPEEKWCTRHYQLPIDPTCCCAQGHCGRTDNWLVPQTPELLALRSLFSAFDLSVIDVNDDAVVRILPWKEYPIGHTPKQRILAALKWIKEQIEMEPSNV